MGFEGAARGLRDLWDSWLCGEDEGGEWRVIQPGRGKDVVRDRIKEWINKYNMNCHCSPCVQNTGFTCTE